MRSLIIIPTYNEIENIGEMIPALMNLDPDIEVLVVDDNSPDGTAEKVRELQKVHIRVHLEVRAGKGGLGKAYIHGFKWAINKNYDYVCQMDADFSHRLEDLKSMLGQREKADVVVGSRWVNGGGTLNWSIFRKFISRGGSFYSRMILGFPVNDWTGGFNMWKVSVLKDLELDTIASEGYSFQIEMKYRAQKKGFKLLEHPIIFEERRAGESKMSSRIVLEALYRVWSIRWST